jgi:exodeoxyribonuclease V alpha subunit
LEHAQVAAADLARLEAASRASHSRLVTAQSAYDIARQRLTATDHAIAEDTEGTARQLRAAWGGERPAAQAAAQRIQAGVGRFGRGRHYVESAREQLDAWAESWQPLFAHLPDSLVDPAALAAGWHDQAVTEAIHARAARIAKAAHPSRPEQQRAATAAESARRAALDRAVALTADRDLAQRHANPARIATLRDLIADADQRLIAANRDLRVLVAEPAIVNQPNPTALLATAAHTWQHERHDRRDLERTVERGIKSIASHDLRYGIDHPRDHGPRHGR